MALYGAYGGGIGSSRARGTARGVGRAVHGCNDGREPNVERALKVVETACVTFDDSAQRQ